MLPKGTIGKVFDYYYLNSTYESEVMRAFREFFERPDLEKGGFLNLHPTSEGLFNEWFLYDFLLANGKTPFANFIRKNPLDFSPSKMKLYKDILKSNVYGIYEVVSIDVGYGLKVNNLQTNKEVFVHENKLTHQVKIGDCFFARVAFVDSHYEFIGADTFVLNFSDKDKKILHRGIENTKITPQFVNKVVTDKQVHQEWEGIIRDTIKRNE